MSLGWQTESALLPGKIKHIHVDNKSMVGLKALVLQQEQQLKMKQGQSHERSMRNLAKTPLYTGSKNKDKLDPGPSNKKEGEKSNDSQPPDPEDLAIEIRAQRALEAKARLYEEMSQGKIQGTGDASLVNFQAKKQKKETEDLYDAEYGPVVNNNQSMPPSSSSQQPPQYSYYGPAPSSSGNSSGEGDRKDRGESATKGETSSRVLISGYGPDQWQWNNTANKGTTNNNQASNEKQANGPNGGNKSGARVEEEDPVEVGKRERQQERVYQQEVERRVDEEMSKPITGISKEARVKTQWEKTLNSSARDYLDQIHRETEKGRGAAAAGTYSGVTGDGGTVKLSAKEERLELIKRKRELAAMAAANKN